MYDDFTVLAAMVDVQLRLASAFIGQVLVLKG